MNSKDSNIERMQEEHEYLKNIQVSLYENFNILLENQKSKVDNQDLVVQNQSLIIRNQDVIVNNQINIIRNQHQIVENQVTLAVILKTQAKILHLIENMVGNQKSEKEVNLMVKEIFDKTKSKFDIGNLKAFDMDL
jgi:hypothetical protein